MHFSYGNVCLKLIMYCVFTLDSVFKSVPPKGSEPTWQTSMLYSYSVLLICVNETVYLFWNLPFFKIHVNGFMAGDNSPGANVISMHVVGEGPGAILWVLRHFLCLISRLWWHHSSTLAWQITWIEEPGRLQSLGSLGVNWATSLSTFMHWRRKWQPTLVFLPGESRGRGARWAAVYWVAQS